MLQQARDAVTDLDLQRAAAAMAQLPGRPREGSISLVPGQPVERPNSAAGAFAGAGGGAAARTVPPAEALERLRSMGHVEDGAGGGSGLMSRPARVPSPLRQPRTAFGVARWLFLGQVHGLVALPHEDEADGWSMLIKARKIRAAAEAKLAEAHMDMEAVPGFDESRPYASVVRLRNAVCTQWLAALLTDPGPY